MVEFQSSITSKVVFTGTLSTLDPSCVCGLLDNHPLWFESYVPWVIFDQLASGL